jgi:hypothetical protein
MPASRTIRSTLLPTLFFAGALALAACGSDGADAPTPDSVPDASVAIVGEVPVTQAALERRFGARARGISPLSGTESSTEPLDPPKFNRCIASVRRQVTQAARQGGSVAAPAVPDRPQLREACEQRYEQLRLATLSQMIEDQWLIQQAEQEGLGVSDDEVSERLDGYRSSFAGSPARSRAAYQRLLNRSGLEPEDVEAELKARIAQERLLVQQTEAAETPTAEELRDFYESNPQLFGRPGSRVVEIVSTEDEAAADEAKQRSEGEEQLSQVSTEVSNNVSILAGDGILTITQGPGPLSADLVDEVFSAGLKSVVGPFEAEDGNWYVFRVLSETAADVKPFEQVQRRVLDETKSNALRRAQVEARNQLQEDWRPKTLCAEELLVAQCSNGPELPPLPVP